MRTETIAGFELREGVKITDLDSWPSFAEWWEHQYGFPPLVIGDRLDSKCKEIFEAYLEGAHWQWMRSMETKQ